MRTTGPSSSDSVTCCPGAARSENSGARVPGRSALETVVLVDIANSSRLRDSSNCWVCPALSLSTDFEGDATRGWRENIHHSPRGTIHDVPVERLKTKLQFTHTAKGVIRPTLTRSTLPPRSGRLWPCAA